MFGGGATEVDPYGGDDFQIGQDGEFDGAMDPAADDSALGDYEGDVGFGGFGPDTQDADNPGWGGGPDVDDDFDSGGGFGGFGPDQQEADNPGWGGGPDVDDGADFDNNHEFGGFGPDQQEADNPGWNGDTGEGADGADPIVLDLDGDGVELVDLDASTAFFDFNGDGYRNNVGWAAADDGILAHDANGDGIVNDSSEIDFRALVEGAETDLEGLVFFDTNDNGMLDAGDDAWASFGVWQDLDQDGETDEGEFQSLDDWGIVSIDLTSDGMSYDEGANHVFGTGSYTLAGGETRALTDTLIATSAAGFRENEDGSLTVGLADGSGIYFDGRFGDLDLELDRSGYAAIFGFDGADVLDGGPALARRGTFVRPVNPGLRVLKGINPGARAGRRGHEGRSVPNRRRAAGYGRGTAGPCVASGLSGVGMTNLPVARADGGSG